MKKEEEERSLENDDDRKREEKGLEKFRMNVILNDVLKDRDTHLSYYGGEGTSSVATQTMATPLKSQQESVLASLLSNSNLMQHLHQQVAVSNPTSPALSPSPSPSILHQHVHAPSLLMDPSANSNFQQQQQQQQQKANDDSKQALAEQLVLLARQILPKGKPSSFRGITRRKKRWEAHVWRHGKQQYLGGYKEEEAAARAYDKAVIKIRGKEGDTNFPSSEYVDEMKRLRADELTVDEFILVLRDEAKKRSKQLKEEEEDRRIAMLKQLNEGGRSDALNEYLDMNRQQVPSSSTITGKRERGAGDVLSTLAAVSQGLVVGSKHQQQMNAEAILDSYLEMTRKAKRQKREQEKVALASHQSHHASMLASLLQSHGQGGGGGGGGGASASTGTSPITPSLSLGGVDPQQLMAQMLNAESLLVGQQQNSLVLQALAQQQQRLEHQQLEQRARSMTSLSLLQQHQEKPLHPPPQLTTTTTTAGAAAATTTSSKTIPLDQSSGDALRNLLSRPPTAQITHTLSNVSKATIASITPPSSDAGSLTVSNHSDSG